MIKPRKRRIVSPEAKSLLISGGRVIDPSQKIDLTADVVVEENRIKSIGGSTSDADRTIDASGMIVTPGLIDMHVHLREPGTLESALAGGFTSIASMANTDPPVDSAASIESVLLQAQKEESVNVFPVGTATKKRQGLEVSDMDEMARAGAVGFSDDGDYVADEKIMRAVLEHAKTLDRVVLSHCEDKNSPDEEETAAARDVDLAESTGARIHIMHVSTAGTVDLIRQAKARGVRVTAEAAPHHLVLTAEDIPDADPNYKMNPPLRSQSDLEALRDGIRDGTIDCIASDHAPHPESKKKVGFEGAPFGVIGMESLLAVVLTELVHTGIIPVERVVRCLTTGPAGALTLERGALTNGAAADITIFDPNEQWRIDVGSFESKSRNCPFNGKFVKGRVKYVLVDGIVKYPF